MNEVISKIYESRTLSEGEGAGTLFSGQRGGRVCVFSPQSLLALRMVAGQFAEERQFFQRWGAVQAGMLLDAWNTKLMEKAGHPVDSLGLTDFLCLFSRDFAAFGWGFFSFDLSGLMTKGVAEVRLKDSIFWNVFQEPFCDWAVSGLLGEMFTILSGQRLRAVQVDCPSTGAAQSRFLISDADRIRILERLPSEERARQERF